MSSSLPNITLHHLLIEDKKQIGLQHYKHRNIDKGIDALPNTHWSEEHNMSYVLNSKANLNLIFQVFKGVAWINCQHFFPNSRRIQRGAPVNINTFRQRKLAKDYRAIPEEYLQKLELKAYAMNTAKVYVAMFEKFINHYANEPLLEINEKHIRAYLQLIVQQGKSHSYLNQMVNSIKFYYEIVLGMPNRFYDIERPLKQDTIPKVISKEEIGKMINTAKNIKHRCIISLLYSAGLRRSELIDLTIGDIDSKRMVIQVRQGKGYKDRLTLLSKSMLDQLRQYYKQWKPKLHLFEGPKGGQYSATSVGKIVSSAGKQAGVLQKVSPHMLRHSFATHLLEDGVNLRYIQELLGHNSSKTTEIYTRVATTQLSTIKSPLDSIDLGSNTT
jgi:integrase/recombinase XerD